MVRTIDKARNHKRSTSRSDQINSNCPAYLLDTTVFSMLTKGHEQRSYLQDWLDLMPLGSIFVPYGAALVVAHGTIRILNRRPRTAEHLKQSLQHLISGQVQLLSPSEDMLELHAQMTVEPELKNLWTTDPRVKDPAPNTILEIAATAISMNASIVTGRVRKFREIDRLFPLPEIIDCQFDRNLMVP